MQKKYLITTPTDREIDVTWTVDAPRETVWKAYTDPNLIPKWYGPSRYTITVEKMEMKPGGQWRYISRGQDGSEDAFYGEVREVKHPERIVETFEWGGMPGHGSTDTALFEDQNGKTKITTKSIFQNKEDRDGMLGSGMEEGMAESIERLDALVKDLQGGQPSA